MTKINTTDDELESLMAELEAQNAEIAAAAKPAVEPEPGPVPEGRPGRPDSIPDDQAIVEMTPEPVSESPFIDDELKGGREALIPLPTESIPVTTQRRVVMNEDGTVKQPAISNKMAVETEKVANHAVKPSEVPAPILSYYIDVDQFRTDTRVTEAALDACMIEQNGLRAFYGAQAARAEAQASRVKAKFEVVEATLYDHHRRALVADPTVKVTEKMVENAVKLDLRWLKAKNLVIEGESIAAINKSMVQSLADRRDMIIQLGADRRDEYKGAARVLAGQNERDELKSRASAAYQQSRA